MTIAVAVLNTSVEITVCYYIHSTVGGRPEPELRYSVCVTVAWRVTLISLQRQSLMNKLIFKKDNYVLYTAVRYDQHESYIMSLSSPAKGNFMDPMVRTLRLRPRPKPLHCKP